MSKQNKFGNKENPREALPLRYDDQRQGRSHSFSKWNDQQYIAQSKAVDRMRECNKLDVQTASDVTSVPKKWVYLDWLLEGELTALAGPPGSGKTTFVCALAAGVTIGKRYSLHPELRPSGSGHVIIINREDDRAKGLKARLQAAGADLDKVHFIGVKVASGDDSPFSFSSERDMNRLEGLSEQLKNNVGLLIVDPIYFAVDGDPSSNHNARQAYERLTALSKRLKCAILGISHTARNTQGKDLLGRIAGPPALREVPRAIMLLSKISNGPTETGGTHVLTHAKNSEGKMDGGFEYRIKAVEMSGQDGTIETPKFVVTRQLFDSADDILEQADRGITVEKLSKSEVAVRFLRSVLKGGPRPWIEVKELAQDAGVKNGTLMNAKTFLKIDTEKRKGDGRSVWRLPDFEGSSSPVD
ncbi:AAA family ATPase [Undibacterium sp. TJN25]|uniref:AAA family ATPase n=1 Tax=Undibacterium sp. TJN25 TaxID=3413056 RepID=UPI003BF241C6